MWSTNCCAGAPATINWKVATHSMKATMGSAKRRRMACGFVDEHIVFGESAQTVCQTIAELRA